MSKLGFVVKDLVGLGQAGLGVVEFSDDPCAELTSSFRKKDNGTKCSNSMVLARWFIAKIFTFFERTSFEMIEN